MIFSFLFSEADDGMMNGWRGGGVR